MIRHFALVLVSLVAASWARAQEAPPAEAPKWLVRVDVTGEEARSRRGIVVKDGRVVTTMRSLEGAETVRVKTSDGAEFEATGVVSYQSDANLALLAIDWRRTPAPEAVLAGSVKVSGDDVTVLKLEVDGDKSRPVERVTTRLTWLDRGWAGLGLTEKGIGLDWGGAPVVNEKGEVLGLVTGARAGGTTGGKFYAGVYITRAELIAALGEVPEMNWAQWRERLANIEKTQGLTGELAKLAHKDGLAAAKKKAEEIVALDPRNTYAWSIIGTVLMEEDDYEEAIAAARKAVAINPLDPFSHHIMGVSMACLGRDEEALKTIDKAVELEPKNFKWHASKGYVLECQQKIDEALECYRKAIKLNPRDEYTLEALERLGDKEAKERPRPRF